MQTRYIPIIAAAVALCAQVASANPIQLTWKTVSEGFSIGAKEQKLIIVDIYTDWCGWCKRMDRDTYADSTIVSYLNSRYVACKMNPEKKGSVHYDGKDLSLAEFSRGLGVNGYPATAFFNDKGELLTVVSGYMGPRDFLPVLKYFGDGVYLTGVSYEDYRKGGTTGSK